MKAIATGRGLAWNRRGRIPVRIDEPSGGRKNLLRAWGSFENSQGMHGV